MVGGRWLRDQGDDFAFIAGAATNVYPNRESNSGGTTTVAADSKFAAPDSRGVIRHVSLSGAPTASLTIQDNSGVAIAFLQTGSSLSISGPLNLTFTNGIRFTLTAGFAVITFSREP